MSGAFPIGIFDSGIGGLTVARAIKSLLPYEVIYYVGDTKNFPYGEKTTEQIQDHTKYIVNFLLKKKCKLIVIACHTATAATYEVLQQWVGDQVPMFNVIDPLIAYAKGKYANQTIGLIGTNYTIQSCIYPEKLKSMGIQVNALATPYLAPIIEQHLTQPVHFAHLEPLLHDYLDHPQLMYIKSLILGSTHYSIIKSNISNFYIRSNRNLEIIDPSTITALSVQEFLVQHKLINNSKTNESNIFISTKLSDSFREATKFLCSEEAVTLYEVNKN